MGILSDRVDTQLCEHDDEAEQSAPHLRGRFDVGFGEALDLHVAIVQLRDGVYGHNFAAGDAVKFADHDCVAGT